jgi:hypothetical protein
MSHKSKGILILILTSTIILFIHRRNLFDSNLENFYPCIAVLVEFRTTDKIISVVDNVNLHIPSTWPIQIFHGKENEIFIKTSILASLIAYDH